MMTEHETRLLRRSMAMKSPVGRATAEVLTAPSSDAEGFLSDQP